MSIVELTENVQFTVDQQGHVTAVVVQPQLWRHIIEALADGSDQTLVQALRAHGLTDHGLGGDTASAHHRSLRLRESVEDEEVDGAYATMLASETVLRREWDTPEEDAAWANL